MDIKNKYFNIVREITSINISHDDLNKEIILFNIDSINYIKLIVAIEEEFNFEFEDKMLAIDAFKSLDDILSYIYLKHDTR